MGAWLLGGMLLAGWLAWFAFARVTVYEISRQARIEVQMAPHAVASLIPARVAETHLTIGQEVRAGDVLIELDAISERLRLKEEETRLAAIAPKERSLQAEIDLLEQARADEARAATAALEAARHRTRETGAAVDFAKDNERRLREESDAGGVARVEALRAITDTQKLAAAREAAAAEVRKLESDSRARVSQQQAQIENLRRALVALRGEDATVRAAIERLKSDIDRHNIRAPVAGRVGEITPVRAGSYVAEGQKLATIVPAGELLILADFNPASALGRVRAGQPAVMRLEGYPWAQYGTLSAQVSRVASEIRDGLLRVELAVNTATIPGALMQHGLPGAVEISVEQTSPAILILRAAGQALSTGTAASGSSASGERRQ